MDWMETRFIQSVSIDWNVIEDDSYLRKISSLKSINKLFFTKDITFFAGENGAGKSTLLEAIAVAYGFNPEGGTLNYRFSTYEDVSELGNAIRISKGYKRPKTSYFFRAESFFNVATKAEEYGSVYGTRGLHSSRMERVFYPFSNLLMETEFLLWMNPKPLYHLNDN